jgi:hypothetical protein
VAHVSVDVETLVVLPRRPPQPAGARLRQLAPVARQTTEAHVEVLTHLLQRRHRPVGPRVEHQRAADVHVRRLVRLLQLEEGRVEGAEVVGHARRT